MRSLSLSPPPPPPPPPPPGKCEYKGKVYEDGDIVEYYGGCSRKYV